MKIKYELETYEVANIEGVTVQTVDDDFGCYGFDSDGNTVRCAFYEINTCRSMICSSTEREDKRNVMFKRI